MGRRRSPRDRRLRGSGRAGSTRSATASCTAVLEFTEPVVVDDEVEAQLRRRSCRSRHCTSRVATRRDSQRRAVWFRACPTWRASTRRSTRRCRRRRTSTRCRPPGASGGRCGASAFTGFRTRTRRGASAELAGTRGRRLQVVTCHLGAGASLCAVRGGRRSTRRWASRRSKVSSWRRGRVRSIPGSCFG